MTSVRELPPFPPGIDMPGGFEQWEVANVYDAIALAERFKAAGKYQYFRGQRDANWRVTTSFARLDEDKRNAAVQAFENFYQWVRTAPELLPYLQDDNAIIAAAQHHGVSATNFIDFTKDPTVAGWFATDGAIDGDYGAIFMVDLEAVADLFATFSQRGPILRFLEIDVHNLWRLHAQSGIFLEAQTNIDNIWPLDRIIFPQDRSRFILERRKIYPDRSSHLEQMINHYLKLRNFQYNHDKFFADNPKIVRICIDDSPDITVDLPRNELPDNLTAGPREFWQNIDIDTIPPRILFSSLLNDSAHVSDVVRARRSSVDLALVVGAPILRNGSFQIQLDKLWAGIRPHPYSVEQITKAIATLTRFYPVLGDFALNQGFGPDRVADKLLDEPLEIEMGLVGGGATRACASALRLWSAMTPAGQERSGLQRQPSASILGAALHQLGGQTLGLFDPMRLLDLFAEEIVPWQVSVGRPLIAFWPKHIITLGLP